jgi:hypothetical protein
MTLVFQYSLCAAIAIVVNIAGQDITLLIYQGRGSIAVSMVMGTGVGLVVKYLLDKRFIFRFQTRDVAHDGATFALYTLMGLVTTAIFWGTEWLFEWLFRDKLLRYCGAVLGLCVGYVIKYHLDKRFVFVNHAK